jgi:hypothetical protein
VIRRQKKDQYLNVGQSGQSVMAESADVLASVGVVERVTAVGCGETKLTAIIDGANVLENRIDGLENTAFQFLELAKFDGIINAVVLHVVRIARWFESSCSGHRVTVHVRESAIASDVVEIHRSFFIMKNIFGYLFGL